MFRFLLVILFFVSPALAATTTFYVDCGASCTGDDGSVGNPYCSLSAFDSAEATTIGAGDKYQVIINSATACEENLILGNDWSIADEDGLHFTVAEAYRHPGYWDASSWYLKGDYYYGLVDIAEGNVRFDWFQAESDGTGNDGPMAGFNWRAGDGTLHITNSIIRATGNAASSTNGDNAAVADNANGSTGRKVKLINNIAYDFRRVFRITSDDSNEVIIYNNTIPSYGTDSGARGILLSDYATGSTVRLKNNIVQDGNSSSGVDYEFDGAADTTDYGLNFSSDTTANGTSGDSKSVTFVGAADFHLSPSDTSGAIDGGTDLSADGAYAFSDDIDGDTRSGDWDLGADEIVSGGGGGAVVTILESEGN